MATAVLTKVLNQNVWKATWNGLHVADVVPANVDRTRFIIKPKDTVKHKGMARSDLKSTAYAQHFITGYLTRADEVSVVIPPPKPPPFTQDGDIQMLEVR